MEALLAVLFLESLEILTKTATFYKVRNNFVSFFLWIFRSTGGGYVCSGPDRIPPVISSLDGAIFTSTEGVGEVQSPFYYNGSLKVGDCVALRHAKAGELLEHFSEVYLLRNGKIVDKVKTYRGEGFV